MTRYFTDAHEWIEVESDRATVGITDHAQSEMGDVVFVEVPKEGVVLKRDQEAAVVESVKAASDVYSPISGIVLEGNEALEADPSLVNSDPEGAGWFFKVTVGNPSELEDLMDRAAYDKFVAGLG